MKDIRKAVFIGFYNDKNQILLQERGNYSKFGEEWAFFGGGIEEGETILEGFYREAKEELGLNMNNFKYDFLGEFIFDYPEKIVYRNIYMIKTEMKEKDFTVFEGIGAKYFTINKARKLKFINNISFILDIIEKYITKS